MPQINEGRQIKAPRYIDVQSGPDYLKKLFLCPARLSPEHSLGLVNGMSKKGYWRPAMAAALTVVSLTVRAGHVS